MRSPPAHPAFRPISPSGIFNIMGLDVNENNAPVRANAMLHHDEASALFLDPRPMTTFRSPGGQDHSPYDGALSRAGPWTRAQNMKNSASSNQEEADLRSSATPESPLYSLQLGSDSVTQDANRCFVCSAQFSSLDKLQRHVWFYQVGIRLVSVKRFLTHALVSNFGIIY